MESGKTKVVKKYLSVNDFCCDLKFEAKKVTELANGIEKYYYDNPKLDKKGKLRLFQCTKGNANLIQKRIHKILSNYNFPLYMFGVVSGKSIEDNAKIHLGAKTVVTIDIKDCFPNTTYKKVFGMFRRELGFGTKVASLITKLVTYKGNVPQGTHSSSAVVALCLFPMCQELNELCQKNKLKLSIWVDDISISGTGSEKLIDNFITILSKYHYSCRHRKIKVWTGRQYKEITGTAINNNRLTVPKSKIKECNKIIIGLKKGSYDKTIIPSLLGKLASIKQIDGKIYNQLVGLANKLEVELN
jgi:hypothetical protein